MSTQPTPNKERITELHEQAKADPETAAAHVEDIAIALLNSTGETQRLAAETMLQFAKFDPAILDEVFNPIVVALEAGPEVRAIAAETLARARRGLPDDYYYYNRTRLFDALEESEDPETQAWIVLCLVPVVGYGEETIERPLNVVSSLLDEDRWLPQTAALQFLTEVGNYYPEKIESYHGKIRAIISDSSPQIRGDAIGVLARIAIGPSTLVTESDIISQLRQWLEDPDAPVREEAALAAALIIKNDGGHELLSSVVSLLSDENAGVRQSAGRACIIVANTDPSLFDDPAYIVSELTTLNERFNYDLQYGDDYESALRALRELSGGET